MNLVNRLIIRELMGPVINGVIIFTFVLLAPTFIPFTEMLTRGVAPVIVLKMVVLSTPMLVTQAAPMGTLLGTILAFGRLSSDSEHIALFAGGISFIRIVRPVAWMGLAISLIGFAWNETVVPPATAEFNRLKREAGESYAQTGNPLFYTVKKQGSDRIDEIVVIDGGYDKKSDWLRKVTIIKMSDDPAREGHAEIHVYADRARPMDDDPKGENWKFEDVQVVDVHYDPQRTKWPETFLKEATTQTLQQMTKSNVGMRQSFKGVLQTAKPDNRSMTFQELRVKIRDERSQGSFEDANADEVDLWQKISTPLAALIFGLVAAPLGIRPHRGTKAMGFGVAIAIIFLYWVIYNWMWVLGKRGGLPPLLASFTPNILGVLAAGFLIGRARQ